MAIFTVFYTYVDNPTRLDEVRPAHRSFLTGLNEAGTVLASGPFTTGDAGALLLVRAESAAAVAEILDRDPFREGALIAGRTIREWRPVTGPWAD